MTMQNLFDLGACAVRVTNELAGGTVYFDDVLAKGSTSGPLHGYHFGGSGELIQATVNLDGSAQLDNVGGGYSDGYVLTVTPAYSLGSPSGAQFSGFSIHSTVTPSANLLGDTTQSTNLTNAGGDSWTPDPCVFGSPPTNLTAFAVHQGAAT